MASNDFEKLVEIYKKERKEWKEYADLSEQRAVYKMRHSTEKVRMNLWVLGNGLSHITPNNISQTEIDNFKWYVHDIFDELQKAGLVNEDDLRF